MGSPRTESRYAVIGAGLAGAATAWQLARDGHEVVLLERTRPAAADGSSHGSGRIFRHAYADPFYARLTVRARAGFDELERIAGRQLITPTGSLDGGAGREPAQLAGVLAALGIEHELVPAEQARQRFPQLVVDTDVLWHPGAGVIDAEGTVEAMVDAAVAAGAVLQTDWSVESVEARPAGAAGYRVVAGDGRTLEAERVVVAVGGWLPSLLDRLPLPAGFRARLPQLSVSQEYAYHFPYADGPPAAGAVTITKDAAMEAYSLPGGRDAGFRGQKVAEFGAGRKLSSALQQDGRIDPANRERMIGYVRRSLPGLVPEPYAETTCLFTSTPTGDFVIDGADGISVVSACSGHGAKFAPLIGELAARLAAGDPGAVPERFRPSVAVPAGRDAAF